MYCKHVLFASKHKFYVILLIFRVLAHSALLACCTIPINYQVGIVVQLLPPERPPGSHLIEFGPKCWKCTLHTNQMYICLMRILFFKVSKVKLCTTRFLPWFFYARKSWKIVFIFVRYSSFIKIEVQIYRMLFSHKSSYFSKSIKS